LGVIVLFSACSAAPPAVERTVPKPAQEGVVQIAEASLPFVAVEVVEAKKSGTLLNAPGRIAFGDGAYAQLGAPMAGRVLQVHVATGAKVKPGDPLVTLDCPEAAQARSALVTSAAAAKEARAAVDREKRMLEQGVGTERDKLSAETHLSEVEAELARATAACGFVGPGSGTQVVLRSPIAGTVVSRKASVGAAVQAGADPIVEVGDTATLWMVADVFERDLPLVEEGAKALVELPSVHAPLEGKVTSIGAVVSAGVRTVPVRISFDADSHPLLRPGMFGRVRIASNNVGISLPTEAVLIRDGKQMVVYVQKDALTYLRRPVTVAQPIDGQVQVTSGLAAGDRVVVKGALLLDGAADQLL
jgi:cobalt-zinc-cadmium efflux system membrane fusion protein